MGHSLRKSAMISYAVELAKRRSVDLTADLNMGWATAARVLCAATAAAADDDDDDADPNAAARPGVGMNHAPGRARTRGALREDAEASANARSDRFAPLS